MRRIALHILAMLAVSGPAAALSLDACDRATHNVNTGEARHQVYEAGWVSWIEWWSNEGLFLDLVVMDCDTGGFLKARTLEENISDRWLNNRAKAQEILETEMSAAPAFFSLDRLEAALTGVGRDIKIATVDMESCACAAGFPDLRGAKTAFELEE